MKTSMSPARPKGSLTAAVSMFILLLAAFSAFGQLAPVQRAETAAARAVVLSKAEAELAEKITVAAIKSYTEALSADEMEGRGTLQPGGDKAARWIARQFKALGLKPLGGAPGSYLQPVRFKETVMGPETFFQIGEEKLRFGEDYGFIPLPFKKRDALIEGDLLFIGYGAQIFSPTGQDGGDFFRSVKGKIVVMLDGPPPFISKEDWEKADAERSIFQMLVIGGAKAIISVGTGGGDDKTGEYIDYFSRRQISLADEKEAFAPVAVPPLLVVSRPAAEKIFAGTEELSLEKARERANRPEFASVALAAPAKISVSYKTRIGTSSNVAGYLEGSDPKLKSEAVLFTAHYDAYGVENGKIYNGAADNALGTAEMLSVAAAFAKMERKPKRSLIFLAVTGEEYGLYGSKYWARNPTWDIRKIAANLNLDGIGTEVYGPVKNIVGFGAEHSTLGSLLEDVAAAYGIRVMPDPQPEEKVFYRSDHYSFVERGVPALMLMGGPEGTPESLVARIKAWEKVHYHQPSDDVMRDWDWSGAKTVADVMGILGMRIADQEKMPQWLKSSRFADLKRGHTEELPEEN